MSNDDTVNLSEIIKAAELAVAGMEESGRKDRAFEIVLQRLLDQGNTAPAEAKASKRTGRRKQPKKTSAATGKPAVHPKAKARGRQGLIEDLIDEGYFDEKREIGHLVERLRDGGQTFTQPGLSKPLQRLTQQKKLRRNKGESGKFAYQKYSK